MFDTVSKYLIENNIQDFAEWLLGLTCNLSKLEPSELSIEPIRADAIILANEVNILHIEMQTSPDRELPFRMLDYRTRMYRKFPYKALKQTVIYLKKTNSDLVHQTTFEIPGTKHEFNVIRLWEQPTELFLNKKGLLPLAVLSNTKEPQETLKQVAEAIKQESDLKIQVSISSVTGVLAGLLLDQQIISQVLRRDIMKESSFYQSIIEEGRQEGLQKGHQEGRQEGLQKGHQEGRQEGRQEGATEAKLLIARNLLNLGMTIAQVATATGLSFEQIKNL